MLASCVCICVYIAIFNLHVCMCTLQQGRTTRADCPEVNNIETKLLVYIAIVFKSICWWDVYKYINDANSGDH